MTNTIATICARGGSVGLPGKNIRLLHGKPLIAHTIEQALSCPLINGVYVSTDSEEIAEISVAYGANVPFIRPQTLATSAAPKHPAIIHLVNFIEKTTKVAQIVDLDPTSPLRIVSDISTCIGMLKSDVDNVITGYPADKNPYFNMVEFRDKDHVQLSKSLPNPVTSRQEAPKVFSMNASIYCWHRRTLDNGIWQPRTKIHVMPRERSIDIDDIVDFRLVELFLSDRPSYCI